MTTPRFLGTIEDGKPRLDNRVKFLAYCAGFKNGTRIECVVKKYRRTRSNEQNRYYWGVVIPLLANHFGYTKDEMHDALKWEFLRKPESSPATVRSTSSLTTVEFNEFVEAVVVWAATNYQVVIPDPNEADF
jgi:hypothetical protein